MPKNEPNDAKIAAIAAEMARSAGQAIAAESATAADQSDADALQKRRMLKISRHLARPSPSLIFEP